MPHIMELVGKTRVVVKDGKVIEVGQPEVEWCPIFAKVRGIQRITPEEVKKKCRELEAELRLDLIIIGVHVTGLKKEEAQTLLENADITTSCASKYMRELVKPLAQVGTAVPLFALTQKGKELVIERAKDITSPLLINTMPLPVLPENKQPR